MVRYCIHSRLVNWLRRAGCTSQYAYLIFICISTLLCRLLFKVISKKHKHDGLDCSSALAQLQHLPFSGGQAPRQVRLFVCLSTEICICINKICISINKNCICANKNCISINKNCICVRSFSPHAMFMCVSFRSILQVKKTIAAKEVTIFFANH